MAPSQHNFQLKKESSWTKEHINQNDYYDTGASFKHRIIMEMYQCFLVWTTLIFNSENIGKKKIQRATKCESLAHRDVVILSSTEMHREKSMAFLCLMVD